MRALYCQVPQHVLKLVSGVETKGTSYLRLSGGQPLGSEGANQLAALLLKAPSLLLSSLDLRQALSFQAIHALRLFIQNQLVFSQSL
jgi:hypothetical protein